MTNKQIWKNDEDKYANMTSFIHKENMMKYLI